VAGNFPKVAAFRQMVAEGTATQVAERARRRRANLADYRPTLSSTSEIARLNPIIRGWSTHCRGVVSTKEFHKLDNYVWTLTYKWAKYRDSNKSKHRVVNRYFGSFNRSRQDRWVFGGRESGAYLLKFSWTKIVRHQIGARHGVSGRS
jgi:hypothetical protein